MVSPASAPPRSSADRRQAIVRAPAKLNLSLAVLARRPDGFHEIESLMVPVSLADTVAVRSRSDGRFTLAVRYGGRLARHAGLAGDVPADDSNLVIRAAKVLAEEAGSPWGLDTAGSPFGLDTAGSPLGLDVELVKRVPAGAGLGGGSSDAAAVLRAAAAVWGIDWPAERMMELAARIGSDVPWFFAGGPAIVAGRGEQVGKPLPLPALVAVIARPVGGLSTPAVYKQCRPTAAHRGGAQRLAAALAAGRWRAAVREQHNDLERPAMELSADVGRLLAAMARAGCVRPMLTGSGSACFALVRGMVEGRRIAARLGAAGWPGVWLVRTESTKVST